MCWRSVLYTLISFAYKIQKNVIGGTARERVKETYVIIRQQLWTEDQELGVRGNGHSQGLDSHGGDVVRRDPRDLAVPGGRVDLALVSDGLDVVLLDAKVFYKTRAMSAIFNPARGRRRSRHSIRTLKPTRPQNRPLNLPATAQLPKIPMDLPHGRSPRLDTARAL